VKGRKRHLVVDTFGFVMAVVVHSAAIQDRDGAKLVLARVLTLWTRLQWIWADGGYAGQLQEWAWQCGAWVLAIVRRSDGMKGWEVLPHRWIVERTFGWLGRYRRLSKDYEGRTDVSEAMIQVAMIHLMVRRSMPPKQNETNGRRQWRTPPKTRSLGGPARLAVASGPA
jgi:putative transposase